ncbi:MAG: tetratricopeptide repeat protein [Planctomycetota bacterium]
MHYHHHNWYHGAWNNHWGNNWYVPFVAGATAWGLNAVLPTWGYTYGTSYYNPYYVESAMPAYDYSQPIVINTYNTPSADGSATAVTESPEDAAYQLFDEALAAFRKSDYRNAMTIMQQVLPKLPDDPVVHEVLALTKFAVGDYAGAAAVLNNLLAYAPGMDWTTLISLYGNAESYTNQLRKLEAYVRQNPNDAAARFVLAYHYLVAGHGDVAAGQLKEVVRLQPQDQVAERMLAALTPPAEGETATATATATASQPAAAPSDTAAPEGPTTDLVGNWRAERDGSVFELSIDENSQFTWKAATKDQQPVTLSGTLTAAGDAIALQSEEQGTMIAQVKSGGADQFQFVAAGSPPDDAGLTFKRV